MKNIAIIGAGISGLGAAYALNKYSKEYNTVIYEAKSSWGGLCDNFTINGFRFDKFIHLSFTNNKNIRKLFDKSCESIEHIPNPYNYYNGYWLKHPAQNNLYSLSKKEKMKIIESFEKRIHKEISEIKNYEEWLKIQYGDYFAENFPMKYTRKYWRVEAKELEINWVGERMYKPTLEEVKMGMETLKTPITYYAKKMRYPQEGGYKSFLNSLVKNINIKLNFKVIKIDTTKKIVYFNNGKKQKYDKLVSSIPLPEIVKLIKNCDKKIIKESKKLKWTSGYLISLGFDKEIIPPYLWFYIYDEDIPFARVYSPSLKSKDNCPIGYSSLQLEVYLHNLEKLKTSRNELLNNCINKLISMKIIENEKNIIVKDIRFEKYANVIFDFNIYESRERIKKYLEKLGIITIGRFGEWDYFWSDQSLMSGMEGAKKCIMKKS